MRRAVASIQPEMKEATSTSGVSAIANAGVAVGEPGSA